MAIARARENAFQLTIETELSLLFPDAIIMKNDPNIIQGIPDLTIINYGKYALLECKRYEDADKQANQAYYVNYAKAYAFGAFIYPENKKDIYQALVEYFS